MDIRKFLSRKKPRLETLVGTYINITTTVLQTHKIHQIVDVTFFGYSLEI